MGKQDTIRQLQSRCAELKAQVNAGADGREALRKMWQGRYDSDIEFPDGFKGGAPIVVDLGDLAVAYTELWRP